jgi:hypothetical protein
MGVETFPLAEIGQPFEFGLSGVDGEEIRSADLRGCVLVIHCWDAGNSLSLSQRKALRELYGARHAQGLTVVGVHLNGGGRQAGVLERALWPEHQAPRDPRTRELWVQASEILALPRMLILDRHGILRADNPTNWQETIDRLLDER